MGWIWMDIEACKQWEPTLSLRYTRLHSKIEQGDQEDALVGWAGFGWISRRASGGMAKFWAVK